MNNFEKRTLKKKEAIIHSSLKLFGKNGFTAVSIKDIAATAAVSQVSIYNYFGSKEALVAECSILMMQETALLAEKILKTNESFQNKLLQAIELCNQQIHLSFSQFISEKAQQDPILMKLITENILTLKKEIYLTYIVEGKATGIIHQNLTDTAIEWFIDAFNQIPLHVSEDELRGRQSEMVHLFLYGLIGEPVDSQN